MRHLAWHVLLVSLCLAHGCGFHLRGAAPQAPEQRAYRVHVGVGEATQLGAALRAQLLEAGNSIQTAIQGADFVLALDAARFERKALSVSPVTGKAEEYQIALTARFSIARAGEEAEPGTVHVTSDYVFDEQAMLGNLAEEETLKAALLRQAATRILRRLDALAE